MTQDHKHFMESALAEAKEALAANEFPVGCVLVYEDTVVARGRRANSQFQTCNELDHAEIAALRQLVTMRPDINLSRVVAYSTMEPCLMCFATMLLNGIRTFVYAYEDAMGGGTNLPLAQLNPLYQEMQVAVVPHVLRDESLALFKQFFNNSDNRYWHGSLLADYTLNQT